MERGIVKSDKLFTKEEYKERFKNVPKWTKLFLSRVGVTQLFYEFEDISCNNLCLCLSENYSSEELASSYSEICKIKPEIIVYGYLIEDKMIIQQAVRLILAGYTVFAYTSLSKDNIYSAVEEIASDDVDTIIKEVYKEV